MCSGNDNLHLLTSGKRQRLRVDLADFEGNTRYAEYDNFTVGSAETKYRLDTGTYNGTAGQYTMSTWLRKSIQVANMKRKDHFMQVRNKL